MKLQNRVNCTMSMKKKHIFALSRSYDTKHPEDADAEGKTFILIIAHKNLTLDNNHHFHEYTQLW